MSTKRVKVHYRRLRREPGQFPDLTLQQALVAALAAQEGGQVISADPSRLVAEVASAPDYRRVLLYHDVGAGYVFGTTCLFAPGQMQAFLRLAQPDHGGLAQALKEWEIREQAAPQGHEFLHGMSYWLALEDHFYQIQHTSVQAKAMEEYLTWLLRDRTHAIPAGAWVELQSLFDREQVGVDLTSIEVGGLVPETVAPQPPRPEGVPAAVDIEARETIGERVAKTFDKGLQILRDLVGEVEADRIIASMPPEASLDVKVNIGYRSTKRKLSREFMKNLESGLRNIPDGEIRAKGPYGNILGDDARLSMDMGVRQVSATSSLLDLQDARDQMLEVHRRFLHDGKLG